MITPRKLAREIIELESAGAQSIDSNLSEQYVIQYVRQTANTLLAPKIFASLGQDDRSDLHLMVATYTVNVQGAGSTKYIDIPEFYQFHPNYNKGLVAIAPVDDATNHFIPRHTPAISRNLPCADLEPGQYSYWTKGLKAFFDNDVEFGKVLLDLLIAAPDSIGPDDNLPIFPDMQSEIIKMVREMIKAMPLQDKRIDSNVDLGTKLQAK